SVALLGVASPVEIGNRVWLDADLNGRQDPDEPGINGAPVELWSANPNAPNVPVCKIGETTTETTDGQPGTYYFRSDEPRLSEVPCDGHLAVSFTTDGDYVVVFPAVGETGGNAATDPVELEGPNADNAGFVSMTWGDLERTVQAGSAATSVNDSDPDVANGYVGVSVGGPGANDHTYDAGWYGTSTFEVEKTVVGNGPPSTTYTATVTEAVNFRGDDRLAAAGPSDPQVTKTSYALTPGTPVAAGQDLPFGYVLTLAETDPSLPDEAVTYDPADPSDPSQALVVISPQAEDTVLSVGITNSYGSFQVVKTVTGDEEATEAASAAIYTVNWTSDEPDVASNATSGSFTVTGDGTPAPEPALSFPVGTEVTLSEVAPTNLPPGVVWTGGTWSAAPPAVVVNQDGTATVTIDVDGEDEPLQVALSNELTNDLGTFSLTKEVTGYFDDLTAEEYASVDIPVEYSYTDLVTDTEVVGTAHLTQANDFTVTSPQLPAGTEVTVTEGTPTGLPVDMQMTFTSWSGDGITSTDGQSATFTVSSEGTIALVATNDTEQKTGTFEVTKLFSGVDPDDAQLADVVITVTWTDPDSETGTIELTQDNDWTGSPEESGAPVEFPLGTVITLEETDVTGVPSSLEWTDVTWSPADPQDDTTGQVTLSDETTAAAATVTHGTQPIVGTFDIRKQISDDSD
ncbi:DUF5979 domain-containing protein, partial [Flavobacterium sp.]|uniref:DUF5979 domain-containing protein n=1 Tax=Flavobacterium sp. TaxID=239 RepID=UPI003C6BAB78